MMNINVIPAVDLIGGKCVRLTQGDYAQQKVYSEDPLDMARRFEDAGASRLHLVDLDGAKASEPRNLKVLESIASGTRLTVEFGGGIKSSASLRAVLDAGASYAICGSIAVTDPDLCRSWLEEYGSKVILGIDLKNGKVATRGWLDTSVVTADQVLDLYGPLVSEAIVTEISHDGMLQGVDVDFYRQLQNRYPEVGIVVSGGVSSIEDLRALSAAGLKAAIVGKAIYENKVSLADLFL